LRAGIDLRSVRSELIWRPTSENKRIADAEDIPNFGAGDAGVRGQAVEVVEAARRRPGRELRSAQFSEALLEAVVDGAST
jgi:hypothetical protein